MARGEDAIMGFVFVVGALLLGSFATSVLWEIPALRALGLIAAAVLLLFGLSGLYDAFRK
jgi:hypothetical protein